MNKATALILLALTFDLSAVLSQEATITDSSDSAAATSNVSADSDAALERYPRRQAFLDNYFLRVSAARLDTALLFSVIRAPENPFALSTEELSTFSPARDFAGDEIRRRNAGNASGFDVGLLLAQGLGATVGKLKSAKLLRRLSVIPSETEIRILNTLWAQKKATGAAIYAQLDSARVTAADLQEILADMTDRGLLTRQQISPRREFTFVTPFGAVPIEMSSLNRKNREYVYQATISSEQMWTYLDASLYNNQLAEANRDETILIQHLRRLMRIIATPAQQ